MYNIMPTMHLPTTFASGSSYTRKRQLDVYTKLVAMGTKPFYASEVGLSGGVIRAMAANLWIRKTGRSKVSTIQCEEPVYLGNFRWEYKPYEREVEVFEWQITDYPRASRMLALMEQMDKLMRGEGVL